MTARLQMADGGAHPHPIDVIQWELPDPRGLRIVHVRIFGESLRHAGGVKSRLKRQPGFARMPAYGYRPIGAMEVVVDIQVSFQLSEVGQHIQIAPPIVAHLNPMLKVFGCAPEKYLMVDGAGAANNFTAGNRHRVRPIGAGRAYKVPVVRTVVLRGRLIGVMFNLIRHRGPVRIVRAGFQQ